MKPKSAPEFPGALGQRHVTMWNLKGCYAIPTARNPQDASRFLWNVILDDERRSRAGSGIVAAEELHIIRAVVVVVVRLETQAELGRAGLVDVVPAGGVQEGAVPVADRGGVEGGDIRFACRGLEIADCQSDSGAEERLAHVHLQAAEEGERIRPHQSLLADLERDFGDDGIIRQTGCIEMQEDAILLVRRVVTEVESGQRRIEGSTNVRILGGFEDITVVSGNGVIL